MRFQPVKCNMMQLTRKRIKKIHASYTLEGTDLENVESIKYLGVTITSDLRWNTHVSNVSTKANRTLGLLRRNLYSCPQEVKEAAYKGLVRPVLDYGSSVWDPPGVVLQEELESVQKRAAKLLQQGYRYHKLQKTFSKFYRRHYELVSKFNVGLKTLLHQGLSEPEFYGDLVYKFKKIVGRVDFSDQFRKITVRYKRIGYNINIMRQSACLVFNPITVNNFASLFNCTSVGRASDSMMAPT